LATENGDNNKTEEVEKKGPKANNACGGGLEKSGRTRGKPEKIVSVWKVRINPRKKKDRESGGKGQHEKGEME